MKLPEPIKSATTVVEPVKKEKESTNANSTKIVETTRKIEEQEVVVVNSTPNSSASTTPKAATKVTAATNQSSPHQAKSHQTTPTIGVKSSRVNLDANEIRKRKNFIEQIKRTYDQLFKEIKFNAGLYYNTLIGF